MAEDIPKPLCYIGCQDLLHMNPAYNGWLQYRVTLVHEKLARVPLLGDFIKNTVHRVRSPWLQKYVVIHKGCIYIFNKDNSTKPRTAFSLYQYNKVARAQQEFETKASLWPFKLVHVNNSSTYFSASSQAELKKWMTEINKMMKKANSMQTRNLPNRSPSSASGSSGDSSYSDIEEPIYGEKDIARLKKSFVIEHNNDSEADDDYVSYKDLPEGQEGNDTENTDQEEEEKDVPVSVSNLERLMSTRTLNRPLPELPRNKPQTLNAMMERDIEHDIEHDMEHDMPTSPAPLPPMNPLLPTWKPTPAKNTPRKKSWDPPPIPGEKPAAPLPIPKPGPGGVTGFGGIQVMFPEKPAVRPKPPPKPQEDDVTRAKWDGTNNSAKETLLKIAVDGAFLIRDSADPDKKVLVVFVDGVMKQYKIFNTAGQIYLNDPYKFHSLLELLQHYQLNYLPNTNICLDKPYKSYSS